MGIKKLVFFLVLILPAISCASTKHDFKSAPEDLLFKNFTLSICLATAYSNESEKLTSDLSRAANGYREFSHISLEAYDEARVLVDKWLSKNYASKSGGQIDVMKCFDLHNSSELQAVYIKYDPCKHPESWLDATEFKEKCS